MPRASLASPEGRVHGADKMSTVPSRAQTPPARAQNPPEVHAAAQALAGLCEQFQVRHDADRRPLRLHEWCGCLAEHGKQIETLKMTK